MALQRTWCGASSTAMLRVNASSPPLALMYAAEPRDARGGSPARDVDDRAVARTRAGAASRRGRGEPAPAGRPRGSRAMRASSRSRPGRPVRRRPRCSPAPSVPPNARWRPRTSDRPHPGRSRSAGRRMHARGTRPRPRRRSRSRRRPVTTTDAPSTAKRRAMALPMPDVEPVTSATFAVQTVP